MVAHLVNLEEAVARERHFLEATGVDPDDVELRKRANHMREQRDQARRAPDNISVDRVQAIGELLVNAVFDMNYQVRRL